MKDENLRKPPFYRNKILLDKFIFKYLTKFFLYGYLFLAGAGFFGVLFFKLFTLTHGYIKYLQLLWIAPAGYCLIRLITILSTTNYKWRLYRMAHYRLNTRGYSENYFRNEIYEPCMRLIVKDILYEYNLKNEYAILKKKYLYVNQRIEDEKVRILAQVIRRDKTNLTKEVINGENLQS
jgi:hypothetical protein